MVNARTKNTKNLFTIGFIRKFPFNEEGFVFVMREHKELTVENLATAIAIIFLTLALYVIAITPPATGYETSIFDAYPAYFWFLLTATITCGIVILLHQALFAEKKSMLWLVGLAIIILTNTIFLLLPYFRGYVFYAGGDTPTHLGYIKDILATGQIGGKNFYPIVHILGTMLILVAGLSRESILSLFFALFSGIYIVNVYLLARSASKNRGQALFIVVFASPLIYSFFHATMQPHIFSLFVVPCLLYLYQIREQPPYYYCRNTVLLLLLALSITFSHPVTTLFVEVVFPTFGLAQIIYSRFLSHKRSQTSQHHNIGRNFLGISLIMFIAFSTWYLMYALIQNSLKVVFNWLVYQIGTPLIETTLESWAELDLTLLQTFELLMRKYGAIFLLLVISGIASISVLHKSLLSKHNVEPMKFTYATLFLLALFMGVAMLLSHFVEYNPVRVVRFALLMGTIVNGLVVYDIINEGSKKNIRRSSQWSGFMIAVVIIVMVVLSLGNVYGSPSTFSPNPHITQMEIAGNKWFGRTKNPDVAVVANDPNEIPRFEDYIFGVESSPITRANVDPICLPSHFGYDEHNRMAEVFNSQDRYLFITEKDKVWSMFFSKVRRYAEEDFAKLNSDPTVAKLYCNGEFEVWRVYGGKR